MKYIDKVTKVRASYPDGTGWKERHLQAITSPNGEERGLVDLLRGWLGYADTYKDRYGAGIGQDYFIGPIWAQIGKSIRELLNGETGRLDCGTVDGLILDTLEAEGFEDE